MSAYNHRLLFYGLALASAVVLGACKAGGDNPGLEYAPNMYHAVPYEPYRQITDKDAGRWVTSIEYPDNHAEYYNSNDLNPFSLNMRMPPANTVKRTPEGWLPYRIKRDSIQQAENLVNPLDSTAEVVAQGKVLYEVYCDHCHGAKGAGDGPVADAYAGVANLTADAYINLSEGHIFHVITHGKGLMMPHGSQVQVADRWKIAKYVKALQKK